MFLAAILCAVRTALGTTSGGPPPAAPPVNTVAPTLSDDPTFGGGTLDSPNPQDILTCDPATWTGADSFSFQWVRSDGAMGFATATFTVNDSDAGLTYHCDVTGSGPGGSVTVSSPECGVINGG